MATEYYTRRDAVAQVSAMAAVGSGGNGHKRAAAGTGGSTG